MVFEKTIGQVVDENYIYARALHYLGIDFFDAPNKKLKEICRERGLDENKVIKSFYVFDSCHRLSFSELEKYPIELLLEYLKHAHHVFIKDKLPYILHLVHQWDGDHTLKSLLPEFVEDFIRHIYEEEDTTFKYIESLCELKNGIPKAPFDIMVNFKGFSLQAEWEHHLEGDEFGAIRSLMSAIDNSTLHGRVLLSEIQAFDREMVYHAEIENSVFFPRAIELEKLGESKIKSLASLN